MSPEVEYSELIPAFLSKMLEDAKKEEPTRHLRYCRVCKCHYEGPENACPGCINAAEKG